MRKVLEGSIYENGNLEEELSTIDLYVSIENMRFNGDIHYKKNVHDAINLSAISFPPMLLQPFVENAIWHGLSKRSQNKELTLSVQPCRHGFEIIIEDNGPGYRNGHVEHKDHKSSGIQIMKDRIKDFNNRHHEQISFSISNKTDSGSEQGTVVRICYDMAGSSG